MSCTQPRCALIYVKDDGKHFTKFYNAYQGESLPEVWRIIEDSSLVTAKDKNGDLGRFVKPCLIPCGKCLGCRQAQVRSWAIRLELERLYPSFGNPSDDSLPASCWFLTLTYDDEHLPLDASVSVAVLQKFVKRLRKVFPFPVRYFACGEYGEHYQRPHYHMIVMAPGRVGNILRLYVQAEWPYGFIQCDYSNNPASMAYVAGYCAKKILGAPPKGLAKEFCVMSRRPGLGARARLDESGYVYLAEGKHVKAPLYLLTKNKFQTEGKEFDLNPFWQAFNQALQTDKNLSYSDYCDRATSEKAASFLRRKYAQRKDNL